jgi:hypothetical protein
VWLKLVHWRKLKECLQNGVMAAPYCTYLWHWFTRFFLLAINTTEESPYALPPDDRKMKEKSYFFLWTACYVYNRAFYNVHSTTFTPKRITNEDALEPTVHILFLCFSHFLWFIMQHSQWSVFHFQQRKLPLFNVIDITSNTVFKEGIPITFLQLFGNFNK